MALTDKLTNIADAIRGKTGSTDTLTLDAMAAAIAGIETGSGGGVMSGNFTPADNLLTVTIDVGKQFTNFLCYALTYDKTLGNSVKVTQGFNIDLSRQVGFVISTNNAGTAYIGFTIKYEEADNKFTTSIQSSYVQVTGNAVNVYGGSSGTVPGCFLSGMTYQWYAW